MFRALGGLCVMVDLGNGLPFPNSVAVGIAFEALDDELASGGFDVDGDPSSVEGLVRDAGGGEATSVEAQVASVTAALMMRSTRARCLLVG